MTVTVQRLTTSLPGAMRTDVEGVERTLDLLRSTPSGELLVDRLLASGVHVRVVADDELAAVGVTDAPAVSDPAHRAVYVRRSMLNDTDAPQTAIALAREGTRLLDTVARVDGVMVERAAQDVASRGGATTAAGIAAQERAHEQLQLVRETRAASFAGHVARELAVPLPPHDPASIAAAGGNDEQTYVAVMNAVAAARQRAPHAWMQSRVM